MDKVNADTILNWLKERVEAKKPISKDDWLDIAFKLNTLLLDENDKLYRMKQAVAIKKRDILNLQEKRNVADAEVQIECLDEFREMKMQESKIDQILEYIRISKKQGDLL